MSATGIPGPAPIQRTVHMATHMNDDGAVSALCYSAPRRIPYTASWSLRPKGVTCRKCLAIMAARGAGGGR